MEKYKVQYIDGNQKAHDVAILEIISKTEFKLNYIQDKIKIPGFPKEGIYLLEMLWLRVPANIRNEENDMLKAIKYFIEYFRGKLATDRFQFSAA